MSKPVFMEVRRGDVVAVLGDYPSCNSEKNWWAGEILHIVNGARGPEASLFQIACIDSGIIRIVNADLVIKIIKKKSAINHPNQIIDESN